MSIIVAAESDSPSTGSAAVSEKGVGLGEGAVVDGEGWASSVPEPRLATGEEVALAFESPAVLLAGLPTGMDVVVPESVVASAGLAIGEEVALPTIIMESDVVSLPESRAGCESSGGDVAVASVAFPEPD